MNMAYSCNMPKSSYCGKNDHNICLFYKKEPWEIAWITWKILLFLLLIISIRKIKITIPIRLLKIICITLILEEPK